MRHKDPELMKRINDYLNHFFRDNHHAPTQKEIAAAMNISTATVHSYLTAMKENGMISYNDKEHGTEQPEKCSSDHASMPDADSTECTDPEFWTEKDVEEYVSIPTSIFGKGELYIVRADGTGMTDAGIQTGDFVVIRKQGTAEIGNIVVALDDKNEKTLKKYGGFDPETGKEVLLYQNEAKYPNKRILVDKFVVYGVATHVIHAFESNNNEEEKMIS